jgi:ribosomal protein L9
LRKPWSVPGFEEELKHQRELMREGFAQVDKRFEAMQASMDQRFEQIDKRLEQIDKRLEQQRLEMDKRFEQVEKRFGSVLDMDMQVHNLLIN